MHWVYILRCEDGFLYVGTTCRLYRRFSEHFGELGGCLSTSTHTPEKIVAIYKASDMSKFEHLNRQLVDLENGSSEDLVCFFGVGCCNPMYMMRKWDTIEFETSGWSKCAENLVTLSLITHLKDFDTVLGGDYCREDSTSRKKRITENEKFAKELPLCKCKLPCGVKKKDGRITFYCAKKNFYNKLRRSFDVDASRPCDFLQTYEKYDRVNAVFEELLAKTMNDKKKD